MRRIRNTGRLFFCGLGIDRPSDVSLATIQVLKSCDVVYYIHGDGAKLREFFAAFCKDVRTYEKAEYAALDVARRIRVAGKDLCAELEKGRKVAYVTYGHPALYSDGFNMAAFCRARGHAGAFVPAVSSADSIMAVLSGTVDLSMFNLGYQVCLADQVLEPGFRRPNGVLILLAVDRLAKGKEFAAFCRRLRREYSPTQIVYGMKCADGLGPEACLTGRVGRLEEWREQVVHMMSLVLPVKRK